MIKTSVLRLRGDISEREILFSDVSVTETTFERMKGLLGRKPLADNEGLWIQPCNSIHTFFMYYILDLVYLDRQHNVCAIVESIKPWRFSLSMRAVAVLELQAGQIKQKNIQIGDRLQW